MLLILADDLGFECLGANGGESYRTPNLDRLAATGVRFAQAYAQPLCTPTRVQLLTGQSNARNYIGFGKLPPASTTFAQLLRSAGYATCMVGKWQLGKAPDAPRRFGFDEALLWQHTRPRMDEEGRDTRYSNPKLERNGEAVDYRAGVYAPNVLSDYACDFMERQKDGPFLLFYSDVLTHCPFVPTPDSADWDPADKGSKNYKGEARYFGDMVAYVDKTVGKLVAKLDTLGIRENTVILFVGDNGTDAPIVSVLNGQRYAGGKGKTTAAGMHVPLIAQWSGAIPPGQVCNDLVDTTDFLPTLCELAGVALPSGLTLDGRSFLPQLRGESGNPRPWIYSWYSVLGDEKVSECAFDRHFKSYRDGRFFDVASDPLELNPLDATALTGDAAEAFNKLQAALGLYKDARPAELTRRMTGRNTKASPATSEELP